MHYAGSNERIRSISQQVMATQSDIVKQSDLLNQLVLDRNTMEELGRIELLWMYPQAHRVLGFICKSGFLGSQKMAFKLAQIDALGGNGILTHSQAEETDAERVRQLESLIQSQVWTDGGVRVGKITDCLFHLRTGQISDYLLVTDGLVGITSDIYRLPPNKILSFGRKRVLIGEGVIQGLSLYREGVGHRLLKVSESVKQDATQELRSLTQKAETVAQQARNQFQSLTGQVKDRVQSLAHQAQESWQSWNEQVRESTQDLVERARESSHILTEQLTEQLKDGTTNLGKQVEEGIQTLTVKAEEILDISAENLPVAKTPSESAPEPTPETTVEIDATASNPLVAPDLDPTASNPAELASEDFWATLSPSLDCPASPVWQADLPAPEADPSTNQREEWDIDDDEFWQDVPMDGPHPEITPPSADTTVPEVDIDVDDDAFWQDLPPTPSPSPPPSTPPTETEPDLDEPWI